MSRRASCSVLSVELEEPVAGTAPEASSWLLIEQPGPWGRKAVADSALDPAIGVTVDAAAKEAGVRVLLVKHGDGQPGDGIRCRLVSSWPGREFTVELRLDAPEELLSLDLAGLARGERPSAGREVEAPFYLTCTNGRRDPCCARLGRPVARALAELTDRAWECSHLGGHRFAANVVCLPEGVWYGRVTPGAATRIVAAHDGGRLVLDLLRGRSSSAPAAQAAEVHLRRELGLHGIREVAVVESGESSVVLAAPAGCYAVELEQAPAATPRLTSCDAKDADRPLSWLVRGITRLPSATPAGS